MRKSLLVLVLVLLLVGVMVPVASATVHPMSRSECSSDSADGTPADTQNPPGITTSDDPDPDHATHAQPATVADDSAKKPPGCPATD